MCVYLSLGMPATTYVMTMVYRLTRVLHEGLKASKSNGFSADLQLSPST